MTNVTDALERELRIYALKRELQRRLIEKEHAKLPRSERARKQNTQDLHCAIAMLVAINDYYGIRELSRLIGALHDVSVGAKPALFDIEKQALYHKGVRPTGSTMAAAGQGPAAMAADLLMSSMSRNDAVAWLDREVAVARLVDRDGNPVTSTRIMEWRRKFSAGHGAALGRAMFEGGRRHYRALLSAPKSDLKTRRVEAQARRMLQNLAASVPDFPAAGQT